MDSVCTGILGLGTETEQQIYAGYSQWEAASIQSAPKKETATKSAPQQTEQPKRVKKLSYKEQFELDGMENKIAEVETQISNLHLQLEDPQVSANPQKSLEVYDALSKAEKQLEALFARWQELLDK